MVDPNRGKGFPKLGSRISATWIAQEASSRSTREKQRVRSSLQYQTLLVAQPLERDIKNPEYSLFLKRLNLLWVQCRTRETMIINISKHGYCCVKNGPIYSPVFQKVKEGKEINLDQN